MNLKRTTPLLLLCFGIALGALICSGFFNAPLQAKAQTKARASTAGSISIGTTSYPNLQQAIDAAQDGDVIKVSGGDLQVSTQLRIAGKKLTLDLGGNTLISNLSSTARKFSLFSVFRSSLTVANGKISTKAHLDKVAAGQARAQMSTDEKPAVPEVPTTPPTNTGRALFAENSSITFTKLNVFGFTSYKDGAVLRGEGEKINVAIQHCNFYNNVAYEQSSGSISGGVLSIWSKNPDGKNTITKSNFVQNAVFNLPDDGSPYATGGAMHFGGTGSFELSDNKFIANRVKTSVPIYGVCWSYGGALGIEHDANGPKQPASILLKNNLIAYNTAQLFGGGIYFNLTRSLHDTLHIPSGAFIGNHSNYSGGAIDYSVHGQPTLKLKNVFITNNSAPAGGGIWACPTSRTTVNSTIGAVVVGNKTKGFAFYRSAGDDVQYEGKDTKYDSLLTGNDPNYHMLTMTRRSFLGDKVLWYNDSVGARYTQGDEPLSGELLVRHNTTIGLHGAFLSDIDSGDETIQRHIRNASVIFKDNTAGARGGAIATNSDIEIGEDGDKAVTVSKKWVDEKGAPLNLAALDQKLEAKIQLVRTDAKSGEYPLETVTLNKANKWSYTFSQLPAKGVIKGELVDFDYVVKEVAAPANFTASIKKQDGLVDVTDEAGAQVKATSFVVTNKKNPPKPPTPLEPPFRSVKVAKAWQNASGEKIAAPVASIEVELYKDGVATGKKLSLNAANGWAGEFGGLPVYESVANSTPFVYSVKEVGEDKAHLTHAGKVFEVSYAGDMTSGFTITNKEKPKPPVPPTPPAPNIPPVPGVPPTPKKPPVPPTTPTPKKTIPQTGDISMVGAELIGVLSLAGVAFGLSNVLSRRSTYKAKRSID